MKIDTTMPMAFVAPSAASLQSGQPGVFDDLLRRDDGPATAAGDDGESGSSDAPAQLFSFNALGILGSGAHQDGGAVLGGPDAATDPFAAMPMSRNPEFSVHRAPATEATAAAAIPLAPLHGVVPAVATPAAEPAPTSISRPGSIGSRPAPFFGGAVRNLSGWVNTGGAQSVAATRAMPSGAGMGLMPGAPVALAAPEATEARPAAKEARAKFVADAAAETSSDSLSVAVSERDGVLHVIAAAPDLPESVRHKIRSLAEDFARDGGARLGDFTLNGAPTPQSRTVFDRSRSWQQ